MISIAGAAMVAVAALSVAFQRSGAETEETVQTPTAPLTMDQKLYALVDKGLIPPQALLPLPMTVDEKLQDLVDRGLIPPEALLPVPMTVDEKLQDLVDRGLIPRQALEPMAATGTTD